jgi:hypothetical protein
LRRENRNPDTPCDRQTSNHHLISPISTLEVPATFSLPCESPNSTTSNHNLGLVFWSRNSATKKPNPVSCSNNPDHLVPFSSVEHREPSNSHQQPPYHQTSGPTSTSLHRRSNRTSRRRTHLGLDPHHLMTPVAGKCSSEQFTQLRRTLPPAREPSPLVVSSEQPPSTAA